MCNLYAVTATRAAVRQFVRAAQDSTDNHPPQPAIFPDQLAPVAVAGPDGVRRIVTMRWGFPPPPNGGTRPVTNVRNTASPYWRAWLKPEFRCLVPATSFCEYTDSQPKIAHWFALGPDRPLFAFAGIWRPWIGVRRGESGEHRVFAFLTTAPNDIVAPIHAKAMPVMLTAQEGDTWLSASAEIALKLQRPVPAERLMIVAKGQLQDGLTC